MKVQPLDTLIELARTALDSAARMLANEQRNYQQLNRQIQQLTGYRLEYRQRLQEIATQGIQLATFREYQRFLISLDNAIERANQELDTHEQRVTQQKKLWQEKQHKLVSYDTLATRRREQRAKEEQRREQQVHDDHTTNTVSRKWMHSADTESGQPE